MKKFTLFFLMLIYIFAGISEAKNEAVCDKYVRVHILANSNSAFDQRVKLTVRNHLFLEFGKDFENFKNKEETLNFVKRNRERIKANINSFLKENNIDYSCNIVISKERYKKGNFKNLKLPYGKYDSVRILLGKGNGKNLFFIMFPALSVKENVTVKTDNSGKIKYKSKFFEIIKEL